MFGKDYRTRQSEYACSNYWRPQTDNIIMRISGATSTSESSTRGAKYRRYACPPETCSAVRYPPPPAQQPAPPPPQTIWRSTCAIFRTLPTLPVGRIGCESAILAATSRFPCYGAKARPAALWPRWAPQGIPTRLPRPMRAFKTRRDLYRNLNTQRFEIRELFAVAAPNARRAASYGADSPSGVFRGLACVAFGIR